MYLCLTQNLKYCSIILKCKIKNKFQNMSRHSILTCLENWFLPLGKDIISALQSLNLFTRTPNNCENKNKTYKGILCATLSVLNQAVHLLPLMDPLSCLCQYTGTRREYGSL